MALLKAFVLQVVLFGLYKLFLEQVVEQHLVPDELKRNILVGLIGLLCFGIQLYTDKTEDENAEADENPKSIFAEISLIYEAPVSVGKSETTLKEISTEKKMPPKEPQAETISEVRYSSTFGDFSTNASGSIPTIDMTVMGEPEIPASTLTSCIQETTTTSVLNGFSEKIAHEESDDEAIEIDQFVAKEQFKTIKTEAAQVEDVADESNGFGTAETDQVELINAEDVTEEAEHESEIKETSQIRNVAEESCKVVEEKDVTKTAVESKYLSINREDTSTIDLGQISTLNIDGSTEAEVANGVLEESLNINNISSNIIESKEPVSEEKILNEQEMASSPELEESVKEVKEIKTSAGETNKTSSTAEEKDIETLNENCSETSTLEKTMSPSNKLTVASTIQKVTATEEAWVAPLLIDISFIYACH